MKSTLIVAAIATLASSAAMAQGSVTIYGRANVSLENQKNIVVDGTQQVLQNSASRLGFKGTEDLGGGLKAGFQFEHGFNIDTGTLSDTAFWNRQSEINLSGAFGMVRLGSFTSEAYFATADYISMHNHDTGTSEDKLYAYNSRNSNKIAYRLPEFVKGLSLEGAVSLKEAGTDHAYDLAANYAMGPLQLGAGYSEIGEVKQFAVRALYEMGPFVFGGYVQNDTDDSVGGAGSRVNFRLSGMYTMGASEFHANVGVAGKYDNVPDSKANQVTLAYNYNLSKRTKVYAFYTVVNNSAGASYFLPAALPAGKDPSALALGVRHNF